MGGRGSTAGRRGYGLRRDADSHVGRRCAGGAGKRGRRSAPVFAALRRGRLPPRSKGLRPEVEQVGRGARGRDVDDE